MSNKNNKQEERKIMNCITKIICTTYKYIRQLCGLNNDEDVPSVGKSNAANTKVDSTVTDEAISQEVAIKEEMTPAAKQKLAAKKRKEITKKPTKKVTKKK